MNRFFDQFSYRYAIYQFGIFLITGWVLSVFLHPYLSTFFAFVVFWISYILTKKYQMRYIYPPVKLSENTEEVSLFYFLMFPFVFIGSHYANTVPFLANPYRIAFSQNNVIDSEFYAVLFLLLVFVAAPITEEFLFRSLLFDYFRNHYSLFGGAIIQGILFALLHPTGIFAAFIHALYLALIMAKFRKIRYAIGVHFAYNICQVILTQYFIDLPINFAVAVSVGICLFISYIIYQNDIVFKTKVKRS